jgi:hypothetical protein
MPLGRYMKKVIYMKKEAHLYEARSSFPGIPTSTPGSRMGQPQPGRLRFLSQSAKIPALRAVIKHGSTSARKSRRPEGA